MWRNKCKKCGNALSKDGSCSYCIWKGDAGPGLKLKQLLKEKKDERKKKG